MTLIVYGHPASQPSRTVFWSCLINQQPFLIDEPRALGKQTQSNPRGQIPAIDDDGFRLAEAAAIGPYLAEKYRWEHLIPFDTTEKGRMNQFLHMHHHLVRLATYKLMAPHVVKPIGMPIPDNPHSVMTHTILAAALSEEDPYRSGGDMVKVIAEFIEEHYLVDDSDFVCGGPEATLADLICYSELGQLAFANLFDFSSYPRVARWLQAMKGIAYHDEANAYNIALGDIRTTPNTPERFLSASNCGIQALLDTGIAKCS